MSHRAPSFLGSPRTTASGSRGQYKRDYQDNNYEPLEVEDDNYSHHPSNQGGTPPRSQLGAAGTSQGDQSVRRPPGPPGPGDPVSKAPEGIATLKPSDPFESILNPKKHKANMDMFNAFIGHPKKHDPSHIKLMEAG